MPKTTFKTSRIDVSLTDDKDISSYQPLFIKTLTRSCATKTDINNNNISSSNVPHLTSKQVIQVVNWKKTASKGT